jgi:hypothetical protein
MGEWENGRMGGRGEWEGGRVGEWESGSVGEGENGSGASGELRAPGGGIGSHVRDARGMPHGLRREAKCKEGRFATGERIVTAR